MTALNAPLLTTTLTFVETHPEQHNQGTWWEETPCGSTGCFAGWAVHLAGYTIVNDGDYPMVDLPNGSVATIPGVAQYALGLASYQADALFDGSNTLDELRAIVAALLAGRSVVHLQHGDLRIDDADDEPVDDEGTAESHDRGWEAHLEAVLR